MRSKNRQKSCSCKCEKFSAAVKSHYCPLISATISKQHECFPIFSLAKQNHTVSAVAECHCCKCSAGAPQHTHMTLEICLSFFKLLVALSFPCMLHFVLQVQTASKSHEARLQEIFHMEDSWVIEKLSWKTKNLRPTLLDAMKCHKLKENYGGHLVVTNERCWRAFAL